MKPSRIFPLAGFACLLTALTFFLSAAALAQAQNNSLYVVENVRTDVTADNAVKAREEALAKARRKAFDILSDRVLEGDALTQAENIDDITISSLIKNFEIVKEKLSAVRYIATVSVTFDREAVRSYFYNTGESYSTTVRKPILILPWFMAGQQPMLWQDNNPWAAAWRGVAENGNSVVPFVLPLGDIMDIRDYSPNTPYAQQYSGLEALKARYGVEDVFLVMAQPEGHQTVIQIFETPQGIPAVIETLVIESGQNNETLYRRGVEKVLRFLRSDWKQKTAVSADMPLSTYDVTARFNGLRSWILLRDQLQNIDAIEKTDISAVSPQKADLQIHYRGDVQNLAMILDQYNITMVQRPNPQAHSPQPRYYYQQRDQYGRLVPQQTQQQAMSYEIYMKNNRF